MEVAVLEIHLKARGNAKDLVAFVEVRNNGPVVVLVSGSVTGIEHRYPDLVSPLCSVIDEGAGAKDFVVRMGDHKQMSFHIRPYLPQIRFQ